LSLIIATGSNLGDRASYLERARLKLSEFLKLEKASQIYQSEAVDYLDQPQFLNQVLEFNIPKNMSPEEVLNRCLQIEMLEDRRRDISKGPRTLDIDILFWGLEKINLPQLHVPHPRSFERSFVTRPLSELPFFTILSKHFTFFNSFKVEAYPYIEN
jgi:2-amino-4-hydroxy-6-hydroxymethyldihydropteridine diphosphokinase